MSGEWKWGEHMLPRVSNYAYLGDNFASNGAWDSHVKDVCVNGRKKLNQLHSALSNRDVNIIVCVDCCYCLLFNLALSIACVDECVSERESKAFWKGLDNKTKLHMYTRFVKQSEFKKYLHGLCDAGTRLLLKFRSGTHSLDEELGRHRSREGKVECSICGTECESVFHVLLECPAYSLCREGFRAKFKELIYR